MMIRFPIVSVFFIVSLFLSEVGATSHTISLKHVSRSSGTEKISFANRHHARLLKLHSQRDSKPIESYTLKMDEVRNSEYVASMGFGTPPQNMDMIMDTGSSQLWVNSEKCKSESCLNHHRFDGTKSSSFKQLSVGMSVRFGSGKVYGTFARETLRTGPIQVHNQTIGLIERVKGGSFTFDGIFGLAFQKLSAAKYPLFIENVQTQKVLSVNQYSFFYAMAHFSALSSSVTFGLPNPSLFQGPIFWVPLTRVMYWELALTDVLVDGKSINVCSSNQPCRAILDTGTTLYTGPSRSIAKLLSEVGARSSGDCSHFDRLPIVTFEMGGYRFDVESPFFTHRHGQACSVGFFGLDVPPPRGPLWILGDLFHSKYLTVYDKDHLRLGFAMSANTFGKDFSPPHLVNQHAAT